MADLFVVSLSAVAVLCGDACRLLIVAGVIEGSLLPVVVDVVVAAAAGVVVGVVLFSCECRSRSYRPCEWLQAIFDASVRSCRWFLRGIVVATPVGVFNSLLNSGMLFFVAF